MIVDGSSYIGQPPLKTQVCIVGTGQELNLLKAK